MIKRNSIKIKFSKTLFPRLAPSMAQGGLSWGQNKNYIYSKTFISKIILL
jgi:hypothetical protein